MQNRRKQFRYGLVVEVKYTVHVRGQAPQTGAGRTVDISAGGILLQSVKPLPLGAVVDVSIPWFGLYHDVDRIRLMAFGPVIRTEGDQAAIRFLRHEFRKYGNRITMHPDRAAVAVL